MEEIDVLVVGAGPAGSGAALAAAQLGARTLMVDRKKEIGTPVQCGEVIGRSLINQAGIKLPRQAVCSIQKSTRFIIDRSIMVENSEPYWESVTVERKILDKHLATRAAQAGARVEADTRLTEIRMDGDNVCEATLVSRGKELKVKPKMVVAADGVHSTMAKLMDVRWYPEEMVASGGEFEMVAKRPLPRAMQIFLEPEVGLGYGWIIPKGRDRANVGMATVGASGNRRHRVEDWIQDHPVISRYFDCKAILEVKTGDAPVPGVCGETVKGNVIFAGDAAGQTLAFVGEGIIPSYICGQAAGAAAASGSPDSYAASLEEVMGEELGYGAALKDEILRLWSDDSMTDSQKVLVSGLVMSECLGQEDMAALESVEGMSGSDVLGMLRLKLKSENRGIRVSPLRP
ncbi:MAG: geranylgeranyl reductase family protein [Candidatus Methanomethylophilaceae archaeon]|jgi:digeranylgeranylglycerophospholipid reductase|nr:geranylgeranyl reductase family protein [Candidatus Methanomethylophilaceae archaeon]